MKSFKISFATGMHLLTVAIIISGVLHVSDCAPREILNADKKVKNEKAVQKFSVASSKDADKSSDEPTKIFRALLEDLVGSKRHIDLSFIHNIFTTIGDTIQSLIMRISSIIDSALGMNLHHANQSMLFKPLAGHSKNQTSGSGGCNLIDPMLASWTPGVFFAVPIVLVGIVILIKVIAIIVIIIGSIISPYVSEFIDMKHNSQSSSGGYSQSSQYGAPPSSSYGSPNHYSRLSENVDGATQTFAQAYDKYNDLQLQQQQQQPQTYVDNAMQNQYSQMNAWNAKQ